MGRSENVVQKITSKDIYLADMARYGISVFAERNPEEKAYLDGQRYRRELVAKIAAVGAKISAANKGTDNALGQLNIVEAINILSLIEGFVTQAIEGLIKKETDISTRIEKVGGSSKLIEATARKICEELQKSQEKPQENPQENPEEKSQEKPQENPEEKSQENPQENPQEKLNTKSEYYENMVKQFLASLESRKSRDENCQ